MRIVGGRHRGRRLLAPPGRSLRPTADRVRGSLFDILRHGVAWAGLEGAQVLDLFCGTGAVALEALSRGAAFATLVDNDAEALAACRANIAGLGEERRTRLLRADAATPPRPARPVDLAFLDPPYRLEVAAAALGRLSAAGWLAREAVCVVELRRRSRLAPAAGWEIFDTRLCGPARLVFLRRAPA